MPAIEVGGRVPDLPPIPQTNKAKKASPEKKTLTPKQVGPAVGAHVSAKAINEQTAKEKVKQAITAQVTKQVKNVPAAKDSLPAVDTKGTKQAKDRIANNKTSKYIGRSVLKIFNDSNGVARPFRGVVESYDLTRRMFLVRYKYGDSEEVPINKYFTFWTHRCLIMMTQV